MNTALRILLKSALRDRISLFWSVVFPVGLLIGLGVVFDSPEYRGRLLAGTAAMGCFSGRCSASPLKTCPIGTGEFTSYSGRLLFRRSPLF